MGTFETNQKIFEIFIFVKIWQFIHQSKALRVVTKYVFLENIIIDLPIQIKIIKIPEIGFLNLGSKNIFFQKNFLVQ